MAGIRNAITLLEEAIATVPFVRTTIVVPGTAPAGTATIVHTAIVVATIVHEGAAIVTVVHRAAIVTAIVGAIVHRATIVIAIVTIVPIVASVRF